MPTRSPTLRLLQALSVAALRRDAAAAQQGLRMLTTLTDDHEGEQILRLLSNSLDPQGRFWFGSLHGPRVGLEDPAAAGKLTAA
jgi:sugar lactone lactonase YvrE